MGFIKTKNLPETKKPATSNVRFLCTCIFYFKQKLDAKTFAKHLAYQPLGILQNIYFTTFARLFNISNFVFNIDKRFLNNTFL